MVKKLRKGFKRKVYRPIRNRIFQVNSQQENNIENGTEKKWKTLKITKRKMFYVMFPTIK